tara:strand:- start:348 stop:824 length:477 start_codon:yes stop_codon:yes gene_type:complete
MYPITVTPQVAYSMEHAQRPWRVRLEYRGPNDKVAGGWSEKWWEAEGDGYGSCTYNHGKIGATGLKSPRSLNFPTVQKRVNDKIAKGYQIAAGSASTMPTKDIEKHTDLPGPFQKIRLLEHAEEGWNAYDEQNMLVATLTEKGAKSLMEISPLIAIRS